MTELAPVLDQPTTESFATESSAIDPAMPIELVEAQMRAEQAAFNSAFESAIGADYVNKVLDKIESGGPVVVEELPIATTGLGAALKNIKQKFIAGFSGNTTIDTNMVTASQSAEKTRAYSLT